MDFVPVGIFPQPSTAVLAADFPLNADTSYHTVCQLVLTPGTWNVIGQIALNDAGSGPNGAVGYVRLFDGTITLASAAGNLAQQIALLDLVAMLAARVVVPTGDTTTVYLQGRTTDPTDGDVISSGFDSLTAGSATHLIATQIG